MCIYLFSLGASGGNDAAFTLFSCVIMRRTTLYVCIKRERERKRALKLVSEIEPAREEELRREEEVRERKN